MNQCCAKVRVTGCHFYRTKECKSAGKVERDGKWYCGRHDPVARKAKQDAIEAKWKADWEARAKTNERLAKATRAVECLKPECVEQLAQSLAFMLHVTTEGPTSETVRLTKIHAELRRILK